MKKKKIKALVASVVCAILLVAAITAISVLGSNKGPFSGRVTDYATDEPMVYCFLVSKKDKKGKSYWSIKRMAEQCNMSYESVRRAIKSLEDQCLIDVEHCSVNGKKNSNIYTVHRLI